MKRCVKTKWLVLSVVAILCGRALAAQRVVNDVTFFPVTYAKAKPSSCVLCPKTDTPPEIDGKLDDPAWKNALVVRDFYLLGGGRKVRATVKTEARLTYDDRNVYIAAKCFDKRAAELAMPPKIPVRDKGLKWGNSIELFLDTDFDRRSYYQFVADLAGNIFDARYYADGRVDEPWTSHVVAGTSRSGEAWTLEMAVPLSDLKLHKNLKTLDGLSWGVNIARNQTTVDSEVNTSWCGVYHGPQLYQRVVFAPAGRVFPTEISFGEGVWGRNVIRGKLASPAQRALELKIGLTWKMPSGKRIPLPGWLIRVPARGEVPFEHSYEIPFSWIAEGVQKRALALTLHDVKAGRDVGGTSTYVTPPPALTLQMDRDRYHFNDLDGQAVLRVNISKELLAKAEIQLTLGKGRTQVLRGLSDREAVLDVRIETLAPGRHTLSATLGLDGRDVAQAHTNFRKAAGEAREPERGRVPLVVQPQKTPDGTWPVTMGVPFPNGALRSAENVRLLDPRGAVAPCQVRVTARWTPKGYVKWLLLDFLAHLDAQKITTYQLEYGTEVRRPVATSSLNVGDAAGRITVSTGPLRFVLRKDRFRFLDAAWLDLNKNGRFEEAEQVVRPGESSGAYFVDHTGTRYEAGNAAPEECRIEESGSQRVVIKLSGRQTTADGKQQLGKYVTRIYAYAGQPFIRVFHTFIVTADSGKVRYRDIALETRLNQPTRCALGLGNGKVHEGRANLSLVQDAWNHCFVRGADRKIEGTSGNGWIRADSGAAGLTVAVRDFWQNYPKELELAGDRLIVHFWPAHNSAPRHTVENSTPADLPKLFFAHEGEELDFAVPAGFAKKFNPKKRGSEFNLIPTAVRNANALGVAKTHEMLYFFHPAQDDLKRVASFAETFQQGVACMAAAKWVCATEAFEGSMPMHPCDPERFPEVESALSAMFDCERRMQHHTGDYGMWIFGDAHDGWVAREKRWSVYRTWINTHHGSPRVPWLLYARSGNPKYLAYARRKAYRCMDIGHVHFSTPYNAGITYPRQKIKGALNDYKGLVPWHSGGRLFDYNNMSDYMLYNYYVRGDRRGLDVLDEWMQAAVARYRKPSTHRGGAGQLAASLAAYQHTWNHRLLRIINENATAMLSSQAPDGSIPGWPEYAPWLSRFHKFTGSVNAEQCLKKWCDWYVNVLEERTRGSHPHFWPVAYGYHVFKNQDYLAVKAGQLRLILDSMYRKQGDFYDGYWTRWLSVDAGYFSQEIPFYLHALVRHGKPVKPRYYRTRGVELSKGTYRVIALDEDDRAFKLRWGYARSDSLPTRFTFEAPDGKIIRTGVLDPKKNKDFELAVPADGKRGQYVMTLEVEKWFSCLLPMTDLPKEVFDTGHRTVTMVYESRVCFFVPKDCSKGVMSVGLSEDPNGICLYDGKDTPAVREYWLGTKRLSVPVQFEPRPEQRGQVWALHLGEKTKRSTLTLRKPLPPYISIRRDGFFMPEMLE